MSFLKCLCFPNKKHRSRSSDDRRGWQNLGAPPSMKNGSKSKLLQYSDEHYYDDLLIPQNTMEADTWSKLENQPGVKKRRRLDDIFDRPNTEVYKGSKDVLNFKSVGYPCVVSAQMESMYGYTPRAVQDIYASSALEGGSVEDYFAECRNENVLKKFASAERCNSSMESVHSVQTFTERRTKYIVDSEGEYSSSESDTDIGDYTDNFPSHEYSNNASVFPINPFTPQRTETLPYMCQSEFNDFQNQHFDEIFGDVGEVLY